MKVIPFKKLIMDIRFLIRDRFGRVVAEVPTIKEAQEWIDRNKKG